jgi:hypothetical protein
MAKTQRSSIGAILAKKWQGRSNALASQLLFQALGKTFLKRLVPRRRVTGRSTQIDNVKRFLMERKKLGGVLVTGDGP